MARVSALFELRCKLSGSSYQVGHEPASKSADAIVRGLNRTGGAVETALSLESAREYLPSEVAITLRTSEAGSEPIGESDVVDDGANGFGLGLAKINLCMPPELAASALESIVCHELVHLTLARLLDPIWRNGNAPVFCEWIVRGIESWFEREIPDVPYGTEVWRRAPVDRDHELPAIEADARKYYGDSLASLLFAAPPLLRWQQQRLVECSLGRTLLKHFRARHGSAGLPDLLSARLDLIRRLERSETPVPLDPGDLFYLPASRLDEATDLSPAVRLSMIAHALSASDNTFREGDGDARLWLERFVISRAEGARLHISKAEKHRGLSGEPRSWFLLALQKKEAAERSLVFSATERIERFEARVLWARILAKLISEDQFSNLAPAGVERPKVIVDGADAFRWWSEAARELASFCSSTIATWVPEVIAGTLESTRTPSARAPVLYVSDAELSVTLLAEVRRVAAIHPISGALFARVRGASFEQLPAKISAPRDPRYREEEWSAGHDERPGSSPFRPAAVHGAHMTGEEVVPDLVERVVLATRRGRLTSPLSYLLAHMRVGFGERIL